MSKDQLSAGTTDRKDWDISVCGLNCAKCKLMATSTIAWPSST